MRSRRVIVGVVSAVIVGLAIIAAGPLAIVGCYCPDCVPPVDPNTGQVGVRTDDPLSDQIATDSNLPYDRPAVLSALAGLDLVEPNLTGYTFSLLFIFQNQFDEDVAFDVYVNYQEIAPRRLVQAGRQEIVVIYNDTVEQTEAALRAEGLASGDAALANIRSTRDLLGVPTPFVVEFRNFVCSDDHIMADRPFLMAPLNAPGPDGTNLAPLTKDSPALRLPPVYESPAIIAFVIEKTRVRMIELDREITVPDYQADPQEPADPAELVFPYATDLIWLPEETTVLSHYGQDFLLTAY